MGRALGKVFSSPGLFHPWLPPCCGTGHGRVTPESKSLCEVRLYRGVDMVGELYRIGLYRWREVESAFSDPPSERDRGNHSGAVRTRERHCLGSHAANSQIALLDEKMVSETVSPRPRAVAPPHRLFLHKSNTEKASRGITEHADSLDVVT